MQYLTIWDLFLTPVYLLIIVAIAKQQRDKRYPLGHPLRDYYMPGLYAKLGGAIFIALVFQFYYGGGDTFNFYHESLIINSSLTDSFSTWFKLVVHASPTDNPEIYKYTNQLYWYDSTTEYTVGVVAALFGLLNGTTYMPIALLFAYVSFTGVWAMYRTFVNLYPAYHKNLAYAFLFIPSTFVWGSAIFKDTLCIFGLGWMTYTTFRIFVNKDFSVKNFLLLVLSFYLIAQIKMYILMGFLPALSLWLMMTYSKRVKTVGLRWFMNLAFISVTVTGFMFFTDKFAEELSKYSLENLASTVEVTRNWTAYAAGVDEGSVYDIGKFDGSIGGMLSKFPQAVVVTLFRPFPWEVRKVIVALSAIESLLFLYFTIRVFFNRKSKPFKQMFSDPNIIFCLTFALIFAFAVGLSSGNFGALSRYKIPCLPFYGAVLAILYSKSQPFTTTEKKLTTQKRFQPSTI